MVSHHPTPILELEPCGLAESGDKCHNMKPECKNMRPECNENALYAYLNEQISKETMKTTLALIPFPCKIAANLSNSWCPSLPCRHFVTSGGRGPVKRSWFLSAVKSWHVDWRTHFARWTDSWFQILQLPTELMGSLKNIWVESHKEK